MNREVYQVIEYKGRRYTFYKGDIDDIDIPISCDDGRTLYPYEKEIMDVWSDGTVVFDNSDYEIDDDNIN